MELVAIVIAPFVGSFLTTVAHRLPIGSPIALSRSTCPACGVALSPASLVPVVSWIAQRGRCRECRRSISPFYPIIEIAALVIAIWAIGTMTTASEWMLLASCVLGWSLLTLSLIDIRHFILPDVITLPLAMLGLLITLTNEAHHFVSHLIAAMTGFILLALISRFYSITRGREGLGLGDAKLLGAGGAWLGLESLTGIILIASVTALFWVVGRNGPRLQLSSRTPIAFGPFLAIGIWISWLYGPVTIG